MTDTKNNELQQRVAVIAQLLDMEGVPCDVNTGYAMVNIGIDMMYINGVPQDMIVAQLTACIENIRAGQLSARKG